MSQSYENWELILINDGSTDKSEEIIKKFKNNRIRYYRNKHLGIPATRNFGSSKARGNIIVVQDSDDFSLPDRLEKIARFFGLNPDTDVVIHGAYINSWDSQYGCMRRIYLEPSLDVLNNKVPGWPAYRKSVWKAKPFREETKFSYDLMMHTDWILSGYKYGVIDEGLYEYVRYNGSASDRFEKDGSRAEAFKKIREIIHDEYKLETST